jgi:hypothetical protein
MFRDPIIFLGSARAELDHDHEVGGGHHIPTGIDLRWQTIRTAEQE